MITYFQTGQIKVDLLKHSHKIKNAKKTKPPFKLILRAYVNISHRLELFSSGLNFIFVAQDHYRAELVKYKNFNLHIKKTSLKLPKERLNKWSKSWTKHNHFPNSFV